MKRYFIFVRSIATVSLVMLYSLTTFFSPSLVQAGNDTSLEVANSVEQTFSSSSEEEVITPDQDVSEQVEIPVILETEESVLETVQSTIQATELVQEEIFVEETLSVEECVVGTYPVITFQSSYADTQPGEVDSLLLILSQIGAEATDAEDGVIPTTNNISDFFPFSSGWHEVTFSATDSDGCVTTETTDVFIFGNDYSPVCDSGYIYVRAELPDTFTTVLGTNSIIESNQWFPVMYDGGTTLEEDEHDITAPHDISIVRNGSMILINVGPDVPEGYLTAEAIADSLEIVGGEIISADVFSGNVAVIEFIPLECPPVCSADNGPSISVTTETVTIQDTDTLSVDDVLALFGITLVDQDGEGLVTMSSDLVSSALTTEGSYTITITAVDNEDCTSSRSLALIVEHSNDGGDDGDGNGGGGSGGGGGNGWNNNDEEPEGEILGSSTCTPYLTTFMQMGQPNLKEDVIRLQTFLNEYMGENLVVDGVYGPATFEAVKRFQVQEFDEILKPWGITEPTGIARETTIRHINNILCPELNIAMPILYCATTGNLIYPDGTIVNPDPEYILYNGQPVIKTWVITPSSQVQGVTDYQYEK